VLAHHHRGPGPAGGAADAVRLLRSIQERCNGEGQQGVAEENSQLTCVEPVKHERVDSVEESGTEARGEHRGAHQARRPGRGKRKEDRGRDDRASLPEEAIEEVEADHERHSSGQATIETEGYRWQERLVRAGDEVQQEQPSTDERVTDERRQHRAKQER
jgi:hypothetical protein